MTAPVLSRSNSILEVLEVKSYTAKQTREVVEEKTSDHQATLRVYDNLMQEVEEWHIPEGAVQRLLEVIEYAAEKHEGQTRKNDAKPPYLIHPLGVALILIEEGNVDDPTTLITAVLHDTVEDTDATFDELRVKFGKEIADYVRELSDDMDEANIEKMYEKKVRKFRQIEHSLHLTPVASIVKLADKLNNIRDFPETWPEERVFGYLDFAESILLNVVEAVSTSGCSYQEKKIIDDLAKLMNDKIHYYRCIPKLEKKLCEESSRSFWEPTMTKVNWVTRTYFANSKIQYEHCFQKCFAKRMFFGHSFDYDAIISVIFKFGVSKVYSWIDISHNEPCVVVAVDPEDYHQVIEPKIN